jgi:hypothetical protein
MIIISLKDFILTGKFGPVEIGMAKEEVIAVLGEPDDDHDFNGESGGLWYFWYEFFYFIDSGRVFAFQNDHVSPEHYYPDEDWMHFKNDHFEIDPWFLVERRDYTFTEVVEVLRMEGIPFQEKKGFELDILRFESGVTMDFEDRDGVWIVDEAGCSVLDESVSGKVLNGIRYFPMIRMVD